MRIGVLLVVIPVSAWLVLAEPAQADTPSYRERGWNALRAKLPDERSHRHALGVEAIMREMAVPSTDNVDHWGLAGLLHDIDIGETSSDLSRHGVVGAQILRGLGFPDEVVHAVLAHDDRPGVARTSRLDHAVYCADQLYHIVGAADYRIPSDKLNSATPGAVWELAQQSPSKRAILGKVTQECGAIGLSMPQAIAAVQSASKKLSRNASGQ